MTVGREGSYDLLSRVFVWCGGRGFVCPTETTLVLASGYPFLPSFSKRELWNVAA